MPLLALLLYNINNRRLVTLSPTPLLNDSDKFYKDKFNRLDN
jgi:hypothetical protein